MTPMDTLCLCGRSAYEYWHDLRSHGPTWLGALTPVPRDSVPLGIKPAKLKAAPVRVPDAAALTRYHRELLRGLNLPLKLLVAGGKRRRNSKLRTCHSWRAPLPPGSLVRIAPGVYCCTPEFLLLQLASQLPVSLLSELICEFCGAYSIAHWRCEASKRCQPLTTIEALDLYVAKAAGVRGANKLRSALRHALNRSASPMETLVALLLCLPKHRGGYGLPAPRLNHWLKVPDQMRATIGRGEFFCDLYWPEQRYALEYDGREGHLGLSNMQRDYRRGNALEDLGVGVRTLMAADVYDVDRFDSEARNVARHLGVRLRPELMGSTWRAARGALRRELLDEGYRFKVGAALGGAEDNFYPQQQR